jgi:hypothetical protein
VINTLGSNISRPTGDLANFVGELSKRADANGDGSLTGSEFAQFLTQLVDKSASHTAKSPTHPATPSPMDAIARILETFPRTPEGLKSALPSIQSALPGASMSGHDHLDIPGVGRINVGLSFGNTGGAIWRR